MSEAHTPEEQVLCLNALVEVAQHFDKQDVVNTARAGLLEIVSSGFFMN